MAEKKPYDTTLARIAGNIAAGLVGKWAAGEVCANLEGERGLIVDVSVDLARRIVAKLTPSKE